MRGKVGGRRKPGERAAGVTPRRVPMQERGRRRVDTILDAAAHVFDEVGYEAATTNAIAARAGVPIGSIYQFFPNKSALLHALAARYRDEVRALFEAQTGPEVVRLPLRQLLDRVVDAVVHFHRTRPGFRALMSVSASTPELMVGLEELHQVFDRRMSEIMAVRAPHLPTKERELVSAVAVRVAHALMLLAARGGSPPDERVVEEMKRVVERYLEPLERRPGRTQGAKSSERP